MRCEILTAVETQVEVFWVVTPSSVVVGYQCSRGLYWLHLDNPKDIDLKISLASYLIRRLVRSVISCTRRKTHRSHSYGVSFHLSSFLF
jgi:hypothetical protein